MLAVGRIGQATAKATAPAIDRRKSHLSLNHIIGPVVIDVSMAVAPKRAGAAQDIVGQAPGTDLLNPGPQRGAVEIVEEKFVDGQDVDRNAGRTRSQRTVGSLIGE